jgi:hypothetical protein
MQIDNLDNHISIITPRYNHITNNYHYYHIDICVDYLLYY